MLEESIGSVIIRVADDIIAGRLDAQFPLMIWQGGDGSPINTNINEVIANRANEILSLTREKNETEENVTPYPSVQPLSHVNLNQCPFDCFAIAQHVAITQQLRESLFPGLIRLLMALDSCAHTLDFDNKEGKTVHVELISWSKRIAQGVEQMRQSLVRLYRISPGDANSSVPPGFDAAYCTALAVITGLPFRPADDAIESLVVDDIVVDIAALLNCIALLILRLSDRLVYLLPIIDKLTGQEKESNFRQIETLSTQISARVIGNMAGIFVAGSRLGDVRLISIHQVLYSVHWLGESADIVAKTCSSYTKTNATSEDKDSLS